MAVSKQHGANAVSQWLYRIWQYLLKKNRFIIVDNGRDNQFLVAAGNKVIGRSRIRIRRGDRNRVQIGSQGKFNRLQIDINGNDNRVVIADGVKFSGQLLIVGSHLVIEIGKNTTAIDCYVLARDKSVRIGAGCMISRGIEIRASDVHKIYDMASNQRLNTSICDVEIGNQVWIAANATISKNVHIADGCIVAAGAFVNKSCQYSHCLLAGRPAKVVKSNIRWER